MAAIPPPMQPPPPATVGDPAAQHGDPTAGRRQPQLCIRGEGCGVEVQDSRKAGSRSLQRRM